MVRFQKIYGQPSQPQVTPTYLSAQPTRAETSLLAHGRSIKDSCRRSVTRQKHGTIRRSAEGGAGEYKLE